MYYVYTYVLWNCLFREKNKKITLEIKTQGFLTLSYFFICTLK